MLFISLHLMYVLFKLLPIISILFDKLFDILQFTPDLLPSDITGSAIYDLKEGDFKTLKGPIFTNVLLADEINRTPAKTQAALLEAMEEQQVTIGESPSKSRITGLRAEKAKGSQSKRGITGLRAEKAKGSPSKRGITGLRAEKAIGSPSKRGITGLRAEKERGSSGKSGITGLRLEKERGSPSKSGITGLRARKEGETPSKNRILGLRAKKAGESPLTVEDVLSVVELEQVEGVIVQLGGQTAISLVEGL